MKRGLRENKDLVEQDEVRLSFFAVQKCVTICVKRFLGTKYLYYETKCNSQTCRKSI